MEPSARVFSSQRRGRPSQLPPPRPFPSQATALTSTSPDRLNQFIATLALASNYSINSPTTKSLLKLALYSFALSPNSPHARLLLDGTPVSLDSVADAWTLTKAQGQGGGEYSAGRRGKVCGHVFKAGECVYRCRDCALDPTCVLCAKCFHGSSHAKQAHDVTFSVHAGVGAGCCDCGDAEAFKEGCHPGCKFHSLAPGEDDKVEVDGVAELRVAVEGALRTMIDWMIGVLEDSPSELSVPETVQDVMSRSPRGTHWLDPTHPISRIGQVSPSTAAPRISPAAPPPAPNPNFPWTTSPSAASASISILASTASPPSYVSSTLRGKARAAEPERPDEPVPAGPWSVVLWNDEKHSFDDVIAQVSRAAGVTESEGKAVAQRVDSHGRDVVYVSLDPDQVIFVSRKLAEIDLGVTVRSSVDTFYEQVAGEMIAVMKDLCGAKVGGEGGVFGEILAGVLLERVGAPQVSRFQKLLEMDLKLWKEARRGLAETFVTLLGVNAQVKLTISVHFAEAYNRIADAYLLNDREPDSSILMFGVQVFTVPSVAAYLVSQHQFLSRAISILVAFFTGQYNPVTRKSLILTPNPSIHKVDLESAAIKQKRYFQIISDLHHLISAPTVQPIICDTPALMDDFARFVDLFTSMNPNKRAVSTHVEYETDSWVTAFNLTIQLAKLCRAFGEAYRHANALQLARALTLLLTKMAGPRANVHTVDFGGAVYQLIDFKVGSQAVSFHHPLALLFAEMVKNVRALDASQLALIGVGSLREVALGRAGPLHFLAAMDHPLRVIVLVAQIRAGLWVRNGFGIRAQHLHYKEYTMRENTYDQDVFFMQAALVILDPSLVFIAILDRFQALSWLAGVDDHPTYEATQAMTMVEEMVFLLIVILSDPTHVTGEAEIVTIRRELIHTLCLGSASYSDIMRRVSDRFADDPVLDKVLHEVATFKPPVGTTDQGVYTLKPECLAEVNPFFPRYTRNQREEADKIVRDHLRKAGQHGADPVILPARLEVGSGPFVELAAAFKSDVLWQVVFFSLVHGQKRGALFSEVLVDEALHLAMLALAEAPADFGAFAAGRKLAAAGGEPRTLVEVLVELEEDERMKVVRHKVRWCLDRLTELVGPEVGALRKVEEARPDVALEAKRAAAKARQAAIMQQFAKAQKNFFDTNEDVEDDDDDGLTGDDGMEPELKPVSLGSCIVCQDELNASRPFGGLGLVQTSNLIRLSPEGKDNVPFQREVLSMPTSLDRDQSAARPFGIAGQRIPVHPDDDSADGLSAGFPQHTRAGLHASACGHMMHLECFDTYCRSLVQRHLIQPGRCHPENVERHEFVCPLCKSLGNVLLPVRIEDQLFAHKRASIDARSTDEWATAVAEPASLALELGIEPERVGQFIEIARKLQRRKGTVGLDPWKISRALPGQLAYKFSHGERMMISRLLAVAEPLMTELKGPEDSEGAAQLPSELIGYTVSCLEVAGRGQLDGPGAVSDATAMMLRSLLASLEMIADVIGAEVGPQIFTLGVIPHLGGLFGPGPGAPASSRPGLLQLDPLASVVEVAAVYPAAFFQVAGFAFYARLMQVFLALGRWLEDSGKLAPFVAEDGAQAAAEAAEFVQLARVAHVFGPEFVAQGAGAEVTVGKHLAAHMTVFLRRLAILRRTVFGEQPEVDDEERCKEGSELARLMALLRIPALAEALEPTSTSSVRAHVVALRASVPASFHLAVPALEHPVIYELVGLPNQLDTLNAFAFQHECGRCGQVPDAPALCLLCGQVVCNQSYCCMDGEEEALHGECNMHMWTCGGATGLFFLVKKNALLYLYTDKGTFATPPYLDGHGKADLGGGGGRGRALFPMFLHQARYDEVRKVWLNQGIGTVVARKLDTTTDHGGWAAM